MVCALLLAGRDFPSWGDIHQFRCKARHIVKFSSLMIHLRDSNSNHYYFRSTYKLVHIMLYTPFWRSYPLLHYNVTSSLAPEPGRILFSI